MARVAAMLIIAAMVCVWSAESGPENQLQGLKQRIPGLRAKLDPQTGVAQHLTVSNGFLYPHVQIHAAAGAKGADPLLPVTKFMDTYPALMGGGSAIIADAAVVRNVVDEHNGLRSVSWQQMIANVPVYRGRLTAQITKQGDLVTIGSRFVPVARLIGSKPALTATVQMTSHDARTALAVGLRRMGETIDAAAATATATPAVGAEARQKISHARIRGESAARLVWFPSQGAELRLSWAFILTSVQDGRMYELVVDAANGALHSQRCLTNEDPLPPPLGDVQPAPQEPVQAKMEPPALVSPLPVLPSHAIALKVFSGASPTPMSPGWPTSNTAQPPTVARQLVTLANLDPVASPNGWMNELFLDTRGNNVDAHSDTDANDVADLPRPLSSGTTPTFDFPCDLSKAPSTYRKAAIVNLFYWCNFCHDRFYSLGFNEAFGNFQVDNFGRGGISGDPVQADAQDGAGTDNARFSTPPDGFEGRMEMFIFTAPTPDRDGDFDAQVIIHEYAHGLSNRLIGDGYGLNSLQSGGMGEGWSDFMSLCLLSSPTDPLGGSYPVGGYVTYGIVPDNYYRGIRSFPYIYEPGPVTASSKNPLTFASMVPGDEHFNGTIWCQTLWDVRANLIQALGSAEAGNNLVMQLVVDGMKLTPASPTFLEARDAILQAEMIFTGGMHRNQLWQAFAKRGMGASAVALDADSEAVTEAFDLPSDMGVSTPVTVNANGTQGGPFNPATTTFTVINNTGVAGFAWTATPDQPWISVVPASGVLGAYGQAVVTVSFTAAVDLFPEGDYSANIAFRNVASGSGDTQRTINLKIEQNYEVASTTYAWIDPSTHTSIALTDDSVSTAQLLPFPFTFYGTTYQQIYVGSNGLAAFDASSAYSPLNKQLPTANRPNAIICAAWMDLNPEWGGVISFGVVDSAPHRSAVITWRDVPAYASPRPSYSMQIVLQEGLSDIIVNYKEVSAAMAFGGGEIATVGVENDSGTLARQYSFKTKTLSNLMALRYFLSPPTVATPAAVAPDPLVDTLTGTLSVLGADADGEPALTYTWTDLTAGAPGVIFGNNNGTNAAKLCVATFPELGSYDISCVIRNASGSSVTSGVQVLVIGTPVVTWANPDSMTYGTPLSEVQLNAASRIGGTFSYTPRLGTRLTAGTHAITATFVPTNTVHYRTVTSTVSVVVRPATLHIVADDKQRAYGDANPVFTTLVTGYQYGEDALLVSGLPVAQSTANITSPVSTYPITVDISGMTSANYVFVADQGVLTVGSAVLTITADSLSMTEKTPMPTLTATISGLVGGDTNSVVSGSPILATTATSASSPGAYPITVDVSGITATNYSIVGTPGTLRVNGEQQDDGKCLGGIGLILALASMTALVFRRRALFA
jgi:hypothetical protein